MRARNSPNLSGRKVLVVGLGISGLWAARWLIGQGAVVSLSEIRPESDLEPGIRSEVQRLGAILETGGHRKKTFLDAEMIILSPGVRHDMEPLGAAIRSCIPVIGELELASRMIDTPMIGVTGTNGKSTVTSLVGSMIENAGLEVFVGGNIGTPLIAYAASERKVDYVVVEVSSFQLDTIDTFSPFVSVILNISPDHLDRYPDYEAYVESKLRIFSNQGPGQYVILNDDDKILSSVEISSEVSLLRFGIEEKKGRQAFLENGEITVCLERAEAKRFSTEVFSLPGMFNLENLLAAALCGMTIGIDSSAIQKTVDEFRGLPNRLECVAEIDGVVFYNDSKATNVDAAVRAITSFKRPLILLAGGRHKGADYGPLVSAARGRVKKAIFLGEAKDLLASSFKGAIPFFMAKDMDEAVSISFSIAKSGDAVLLAPACSSFDMFSDYSERGRVFKAAVERLIHD
jgi:UDP-N-acetylmuramoylalanine--D-glutamate ligase